MSGQRLALIVANDEYEQAALRNLLAPRADAEALGRVLGDPQIGDFAVQVVRNEPSYVIQAKIEELFSESRSDDLLLLHFSCFGLKSESGELFFAAANTRPNRLGSTAVSADFVQRCMRASRSRSVVLLLDCCYGGAFAEESMVRGPSQGATMRAPSQGATTRAPSQSATMRASANVNMLDDFPQGRLGGGRGRAVITASNAMEYAFEGDRLADDQPRRPSVFTSALVEGLATGDADRDEDGWISLNELYDYVFDKVQEQNPHQTPSRHFELEGELYLARSPRRRIRPAPIPPDLQAAISDPNMYTRRGAVSELQARLTSEELPVATGAYGALAELAHTDIQYVAEAAAAALRQAAIRPEKTELHFGKRRQGSAPPHRSVRLLGPPIARACTARPSDNWIRVNATPDGFDVTVDTARTGPLRGNLDLKGLAGEAVIAIDVELLPQAAQTFPTERPTAPETREQQQFARQKARTGQETAEQIEREPDTAAASAAEARAEGETRARATQLRRPTIFLCYRREDTQGFARGIYESLADKYSHEQVFRDIDSTPAGVRYSTWIESRVAQCSVMIVLIGNVWLSAKDHAGQRRLDLSRDWVRQEIEVALRRDIPIIPVRIQGAPMPSEDELPPSIADLTGFQSAEVTDSRWAFDLEQLIQAIDNLVASD